MQAIARGLLGSQFDWYIEILLVPPEPKAKMAILVPWAFVAAVSLFEFAAPAFIPFCIQGSGTFAASHE